MSAFDEFPDNPQSRDKHGPPWLKIVGWPLAVVVILFVVIGGFNLLTSFKGTDPGDICIVKEGGPFDGRGIKEVRQGGESPKFIGPFNKQHCFPATERFYTLSSNADESDSGVVDEVILPTLDAVNISVEGQASFQLNTDPTVIKQFYLKYGVRSYDGKKPYEGDEGWQKFLKFRFRPILENSLREAIGGFDCVELNNTCQYVQDAAQAVGGNVKSVDNNQNLAKAQTQIEKNLNDVLNSTLRGPYFENIRFRMSTPKFDPKVQEQITLAQAKRTEVATTKLEAQRVEQEAIGRRKVAEQDARAIKIKANSYKKNKAQADIDRIKALCGTDANDKPKGCANLQVVGGNVTKLIGGK